MGHEQVHCELTLFLDPQDEGGYTVTCKELPELITEGDSMDEALNNVVDAFISTCELYAYRGRLLPESIILPQPPPRRFEFETANPDNNEMPYCFKAMLNTPNIGSYV